MCVFELKLINKGIFKMKIYIGNYSDAGFCCGFSTEAVSDNIDEVKESLIEYSQKTNSNDKNIEIECWSNNKRYKTLRYDFLCKCWDNLGY